MQVDQSCAMQCCYLLLLDHCQWQQGHNTYTEINICHTENYDKVIWHSCPSRISPYNGVTSSTDNMCAVGVAILQQKRCSFCYKTCEISFFKVFKILNVIVGMNIANSGPFLWNTVIIFEFRYLQVCPSFRVWDKLYL